MKIFSKTDIGLLRDENQDCVWSASLSDGACAAVLCDGMGGEAHGGLASRIAVDVISKRILGTFSEMMNRNSVRNLLITAVSAANSSVVDAARKQPEGAVMGTTCVAAIVSGGRAYIVNVGDSRGYHLFTSEDSECIQQVTKDHSHVRDLIDRGEITEEQAFSNAESSMYNIEQLHKFGFRIAIDDFGTGLSNLKRFYEINPDSIKVDSQFTGDIFGTAGKIVRIIFDLARYNRIPVIAEGVESEDVARELIKLGCVQAQGYLYQKPMPFSAWDKSGKLVKE